MTKAPAPPRKARKPAAKAAGRRGKGRTSKGRTEKKAPKTAPARAPKGRAKTAFVTGGTGFLGLNLVEQLAAAGWTVTALHRKGSDTSRLSKFPVTLVEGSLAELELLVEAVPKGVDAVFHVAANTSVWSRNNAQQMKDNVDGTRNMVTAARRRGAKAFVHTSTWHVYGHHDRPLTEDTPKRGDRSFVNYDRTKFYAEAIVVAAAQRGLRAVILNPCHIMGRYDTHNWSRILQLAHANKLPGIPPGSGTFCHAEAVAKAHIAAAEKGKSGENYLLGGPAASFREVVDTIAEVGGRKVSARVVPGWLLRGMARMQTALAGITGKEPDVTPEGAAIVTSHGRIASDKAERELGYKSPPLRDMIEDSYDWLRTEGLLKD